MHKNTKLTPVLRRELYGFWCKHHPSFRDLAHKYHVDKNVIRLVVMRGRLGDFTLHDSTNHRYRTIEYGFRRLFKTEQAVAILVAKRERRAKRYERMFPGELVHEDTRRIPRILRRDRCNQVIANPEILYVWIDDYSRFLLADLLPDRTMWSSALFLEIMATRLPFPIQCHYSDNGGEFRGNSTHAFVAGCARLGIEQRFTKPHHPWTNGKAERVIKTIMTEWYHPHKAQFQSAEERRSSLYQYVDWYNHHRPHQGINNLTPIQRLALFSDQSGDDA